MVKRYWRTGVLGLGCAFLMLACTRVTRAQSAAPVAAFDADRALGTWYELAHLPLKREKRCVSDAVQLVAPGDKDRQLNLVGSCKQKGTTPQTRNARATQDKGGNGKFSVRTIWPLSKKYLVLATGPEYEWALVGTGNHKNLWIYSRTPALTPDVMSGIQSKATAQGFRLDRLITVPQAATK